MDSFLLIFRLILTWFTLQMHINLSGCSSNSIRTENSREQVVLNHNSTNVELKWTFTLNQNEKITSVKIIRRVSYGNEKKEAFLLKYYVGSKWSLKTNSSLYGFKHNYKEHSTSGYFRFTIKDITLQEDNDDGSKFSYPSNMLFYVLQLEYYQDNNEKECEIQLLILSFPRINYLTSSHHGKQGDSITLRCNASGYPAPRITWTHRDTNRTFANSSVTSFNITGKESGGKYCCHVSNDFGEETNCTFLKVIALPRINYLTSHLSGNQGDSITLRCNASGNPAPRVTWTHKDTKRTIANSSVTSFNITGKESVGKYCCHVSNDFGEETNCSSIEVLEYQPIDTELTSQINCTTAKKTFKILCKADASPSVRYFIQQGNKTMVNSSDGNATITTSENGYLNFSCSAKNKYGQGKTVHLKIPICRDHFEDNDDDGSILPPDNRLQIIIVIIVCTLLFVAALILGYVLISRKRKQSKRDVVSGTQQQDKGANQWAEESPYGEPVDAIRGRNVIHTSASNADYATVEETGYKRAAVSIQVQQPPHEETSSSKKCKSNVEPVYAIVNKNKKKDKSADVPLNPLNDEIPADLSNPKHPSRLLINHQDPKTSDNKNSNEQEDGVDSVDQGGSWIPWLY